VSKNAGKTEYIFLNTLRPLRLVFYRQVSFKLQFESTNFPTFAFAALHRSLFGLKLLTVKIKPATDGLNLTAGMKFRPAKVKPPSAKLKLVSANLKLMSADLELPSAILELMPAKLKLVPADLKLVPAKMKPATARLNLRAADVKLLPAELKLTSAVLKLTPAGLREAPVIRYKALKIRLFISQTFTRV
jgi:hypothetical protein